MKQIGDPGERAEHPQIERIVAEGIGGDRTDPLRVARPGAFEPARQRDVVRSHSVLFPPPRR
jgi:hypothetical protein